MRTVIQPIPHDFRIVSGCFAAQEGTSGLKLNEDKTKLVPFACTAEDVELLIQQLDNPKIVNAAAKKNKLL